MNRSFPPRPALAAAPRRAGAFSLVVTLIIVSMLAVVAIGFLASMSSERVTADAFGNKSRAEQVAQAGVDSAEAILREAFKDFPDSATVWETHSTNPDSTNNPQIAPYNEGTSLYVKAMLDGNNSANLPDPTADNTPNHTNADGSDARTTFVLPLISGEKYRPIVQASDWTMTQKKPVVSSSDPLFANKYVDLNVRRYKDDSQGWIGSPPRATVGPSPSATPPPKTVRVPWVNISQADATNPSSAPVVARYAFWVEDESFRANVNYAGLGGGTDPANPDNRNRLDNTGASRAGLAMDPTTVDLFGPFRALTDISQATSFAQTLSDTRKAYPGGLFSEALGYAHTSGLGKDLADQLRYLTTTTSGGLNLSRHGTQRVNLNELVYPKAGADGTLITYSPQQRIDSIVKTIQFHTPNFGQRFYRNVADARVAAAITPSTLNALTVPNTGEPNLSLIYLYKVATNIHDYLDADVVPTLVDGIKDPTSGKYSGIVHQGIYPAPGDSSLMVYPYHNPDGGNLVWAQGKDSAPYLDECAIRFGGGPDGTGKYELDIDFYVEVWNPGTRDVLASELTTGGNDTLRVHVGTQPPWQAGNDSNAQLVDFPVDPTNPTVPTPSSIATARDFDFIVPSTTIFRAGKATVLTTDKSFSSRGIAAGEALSNFVFCPKEGTTDVASTEIFKGVMPTGKTHMVFIGGRGSNHTSDYDTEIILYSPRNGYIDFAPGPLPIYSGSSSTPIFLAKNTPTSYKVYGGSLRSNGGSSSGPDPSTLGDPRANNEQLTTDPNYSSGANINQPRYYNFSGGTAGTLGLPNSDYLQPQNNSNSGSSYFTAWPDYYTFPPSLVMDYTNAPVFVANNPLTSIGQLGDVYDPARWSGPDIRAARGGGRTFKIGQPDDLWDGDFKSASRSWAAWRLTDFFCINDAMLQPGLVNINGVARDNGAALRAALTGFKYLDKPVNGQGALTTQGSAATEKKALAVDIGSSTPATGLDALVTQIQKRLAPADTTNPTGTTGYAPYNTGQGPFFERGEFSELPAFGRTTIAATFPPSTYYATDLVGTDLAKVVDQGREELFRRLAEIITTRGNVFTVYAMGQSIQGADSKGVYRVTSTQRLKVTFRLIPKQLNAGSGTTTTPNFHPATTVNASGAMFPMRFDPANTTARFAKPDHYDIEILSASKGGG